MGVMETITAVLTITVPIIGTLLPTIVLTNHQTQQLLREIKKVQTDTNCLLRKMYRCLVKIDKTQQGIQKCLLKLDFGFHANAAMHGWSRADNVSPKKARKISEPKVYDPKLRVCYFKTK